MTELRLRFADLGPDQASINLAQKLADQGGIAADAEAPNRYYLANWDLVSDAFQNPKFQREHPDFPVPNSPGGRIPSAGLIELDQTWPVFRDAPAHPPLRRALTQTLQTLPTPEMREEIRNRIQARVSGMAKDQAFDALSLAEYVPSIAMAIILGFQGEKAEVFCQCTEAMLLADPANFPPLRTQVVDLLSEELRNRRTRPGKDALSGLIQAMPGANTPTLLSLALFLVTTGHGGVRNAIANGLWLAAYGQDRGALAALAQTSSQGALLFAETLRLYPSLRIVDRYVAADMDFAGKSLKRGDRIYLILSAALRDQAQFDQPDAFIIRPELHKPLHFGLGAHACLGQHLAPWLWTLTLAAVFHHGAIKPTAPVEWAAMPDESRLIQLPLVWTGSATPNPQGS